MLTYFFHVVYIFHGIRIATIKRIKQNTSNDKVDSVYMSIYQRSYGCLGLNSIFTFAIATDSMVKDVFFFLFHYNLSVLISDRDRIEIQ